MVPLRKLSHIREEERRIPRNWQQRWHSLRRAAGFRHWVPDICRHSFASYHAAFFRNLVPFTNVARELLISFVIGGVGVGVVGSMIFVRKHLKV